ncbi:MAG: zinc ribbon domain-containing protein [Thermoanaerobaculia bacterium]
MPMYEYLCQDCGHQFEILQRMGEGADGLACPECGEKRVVKQFSTFAASGNSTATSAGFSTGAGCGGGSGFS